MWGSDDLPREDRKSDAKAWWFPVALVVVVALACGVRICAFFLFGIPDGEERTERRIHRTEKIGEGVGMTRHGARCDEIVLEWLK